MNSRIYVGQVRHRRLVPHKHTFSYNMFMMYLDLDELPGLFDGFLLWSARRLNIAHFNRADHLGESSTSLKQSVVDLVSQETGILLDGPIRLLTHMRYFGYGFNPVSFYYCFDKNDENIEVIVAEVNNTPWGEQHCYVLPVDSARHIKKGYDFELIKRFHVSPFNPMQQDYKWYFTLHGKRLSVYMENWQNDMKVFDASLALDAREISSSSLAQTLITYPFMTLKIIPSIYYQALRLFLKRTPLFTHPDKIISSTTETDEVKS